MVKSILISLEEMSLKTLPYNFLMPVASTIQNIDLSNDPDLVWTVPHYFCPRAGAVKINIKNSPNIALGVCTPFTPGPISP